MHEQNTVRNRKFQTRTIVIGIVFSIFIVLTAALGMLSVTRNTTRALSRELVSKLVRQVSLNVDGNISQIRSLLINITIDQDVMDILEQHTDEGGELSLTEQRVLQNKMLQTQLIRNDIRGLYIFDSVGTPYYCSPSPSLRQDYRIQDESWYPGLAQVHGIKVLSTHVPERYLVDKTPVFTILEQLKSLRSRKTQATIVVDVGLSMFDNIVENLQLSQDYVMLILNENDELIYSNEGIDLAHSKAGILYQMIRKDESVLDSSDKNIRLDGDAGTLYTDYTVSAQTGWKVVCGVDVDKITNLPSSTRSSIARLVLLTSVMTLLFLTLILLRLFRTLNKLQSGMEAVRAGRYDIQLADDQPDEIGDLCRAFNSMSARLNYLINTVNQMERDRQRGLLNMANLELSALQAQINPHFIFNTLETINMMAEVNGDANMQTMAVSLAKMIRVAVSGDAIVTVGEELEHAESYLRIQNIRFAKRVKVTMQIDREILPYRMPKLILQPLIENCYSHGLEQKEENGEILVRGYCLGQKLIFEVSDNGAGIAPEKLEQIRENMKRQFQTEHSRQGIGLNNVNQRIRLRYQSAEYGLRIESEPDVRTTVYVTLPLDTGEAEKMSGAEGEETKA
jgi:two-component system sensor histidine kinase YesM